MFEVYPGYFKQYCNTKIVCVQTEIWRSECKFMICCNNRKVLLPVQNGLKLWSCDLVAGMFGSGCDKQVSRLTMMILFLWTSLGEWITNSWQIVQLLLSCVLCLHIICYSVPPSSILVVFILLILVTIYNVMSTALSATIHTSAYHSPEVCCVNFLHPHVLKTINFEGKLPLSDFLFPVEQKVTISECVKLAIVWRKTVNGQLILIMLLERPGLCCVF